MEKDIFELYQSNEDSEENGRWFSFSDNAKFKIRRMGGANAKRVQLAMAKIYKPYAKQIEMGTLDQKKERELTIKCFVEACIADWKVVSKGIELPFSKEVAIDKLSTSPNLVEDLVKFSQSIDNYKDETVEVGNS